MLGCDTARPVGFVPVGTAADVLLLGTRECRIDFVGIEVLDLLRTIVRISQLVHVVAIVGELVDTHTTVVSRVRIGIAQRSRMFRSLNEATVMVDDIPLALELGDTVMVIVVRVDVAAVDVRVIHEDALVRIGTHRIARRTVSDTQIGGTVRKVVGGALLVDVGGFHRLRAANLQLDLGTHVKTVDVLVELVDVEDVVVIVPGRARVAIAAAEGKVALAVVIEEDGRVEAPADAVAVRDAATPVVDEFLVVGNRVLVRSLDFVSTDEPHATATAIGIDDVEPAIGADIDTRSPNVADVIVFTLGLEDNTEVRPVLHIATAKSIERLDGITITAGRVVRVCYDVKIFVIRRSRRICQVMVIRNRVVRQGRSNQTAGHRQHQFPLFFEFHKTSLIFFDDLNRPML